MVKGEKTVTVCPSFTELVHRGWWIFIDIPIFSLLSDTVRYIMVITQQCKHEMCSLNFTRSPYDWTREGQWHNMVTNRHSSSPYKGIVPANHFKVLLLHWCLKMPTKAQIPVMQIWKMLGMPRLMSNGKHVWKISIHTSAKLQTSVGRC